MANTKVLYPVSTTVAITCALASLASDVNLLAGRAGTAIDNTTNLDLDHVLSGVIRVSGTAPTAGTVIEIWSYAPVSIAGGVPTYPDGITGTDANKTLTSANVKSAALVFLTSITLDAVASRDYSFRALSIATQFGGFLPQFWGPFVVQSSGQALNATQVSLQYDRRQAQSI